MSQPTARASTFPSSTGCLLLVAQEPAHFSPDLGRPTFTRVPWRCVVINTALLTGVALLCSTSVSEKPQPFCCRISHEKAIGEHFRCFEAPLSHVSFLIPGVLVWDSEGSILQPSAALEPSLLEAPKVAATSSGSTFQKLSARTIWPGSNKRTDRAQQGAVGWVSVLRCGLLKLSNTALNREALAH